MTTLENTTLQLLARYTMARKFAPYGNELIALVGTGTEPTNLLAVTAWIEARYDELDQDLGEITPNVVGDFDQHMAWLVREAFSGERPVWAEVDCLPQNPLDPEERLLISTSMLFLLRGPMEKGCLAELLSILVPGRHTSPAKQVEAWIKTKKRTYTYYPSELTLPLTQQLLWELGELVGDQ